MPMSEECGGIDDAVAWIASGAAAVPISPAAELSVRLFAGDIDSPARQAGRRIEAAAPSLEDDVAAGAAAPAEERPEAQVEVHALAAGLDVQHPVRGQAGVQRLARGADAARRGQRQVVRCDALRTSLLSDARGADRRVAVQDWRCSPPG